MSNKQLTEKSKMVISIHQPNFIPWLGYFYKIARSDVFVFLDDVQFTKNSYINRNRVKTPQGSLWLTIPVKVSGSFGQSIADCIILQKEATVKRILNTVKLNYSKAPFFQRYYPEFVAIMQMETEHLSEINIALIKWICTCLDITTPTFTSSSLNIPKALSTERLISICNALGGTTYLCGKGGSKYQDERLFKEHNIDLTVSSFLPPLYTQLWGEFIPELSVLDLLFNIGSDTAKLMHNSNEPVMHSTLHL